jgi:hypothetical protein
MRMVGSEGLADDVAKAGDAAWLGDLFRGDGEDLALVGELGGEDLGFAGEGLGGLPIGRDLLLGEGFASLGGGLGVGGEDGLLCGGLAGGRFPGCHVATVSFCVG